MSKQDKSNGEQNPILDLQITVDYDSEYQEHYSNYASVSHTPNDLCIDFCVATPPHNIDKKEKKLLLPLVTRVIIPPNMVMGLIKALEIQLSSYEQVYKKEKS